jgi:hypothetical protein
MKRGKVFVQISIAFAALCCTTIMAGQHAATDSIDGRWIVTFTMEGQTVPGQMSFQAHGERLDGNMETQHTGRGDLNGGAWSHNKLSGIYIFKGHEALAIAGEFSEGKLAGVFRTEGTDGKWEAVREKSQQ